MNKSQKQNHCSSILFNVLAVLLVGTGASQTNAADLNINLVAQRVERKADGSESLLPAAKAKPGDIIEYTAHYKNQSKGPITNVHPMLPIPEGMEYIPATARPAPAAASLDGKSFSAIPLKRKLKGPSGELLEQDVPASEYRALQWRVNELSAGKTAILSARVRVTTSGQISVLPDKAKPKVEINRNPDVKTN
jgi:uncharacterized repeat protein (TIGR01451 family)